MAKIVKLGVKGKPKEIRTSPTGNGLKIVVSVTPLTVENANPERG